MQLKSNNPIPAVSPTACFDCGAEERRLLHLIGCNGGFRRLCTSCVLRHHTGHFCPTCFQFYPNSPPNDPHITCSRCSSATHTHCVSSPSPSPYICALCVNPKSALFKLKSAKEANVKIGDGGGKVRVMDRDAAKKLLAAARITSMFMDKAAATARVDAEKRAKEAADARKRARDALDHLARLMTKEKRKKDNNNVNGYGGGGSSSRNANVGSVDVVDSSNKVLALLNAVELRENGKNSERMLLTGVNGGNGSMMEVDEGVEVLERNNGGGIDHVVSSDIESDDEQDDVNSDDSAGEEQHHANLF